jgi:hypothetical protein
MKIFRLGCVVLCVLAVTAVAQAEDYEPGLAGHYYKDVTNWNGLWPSDTDAPLADPKTCTFTEYKYTQVEPVVNHLFVRSGWFSVRWVGYIDVPGNGDDANAFLLELWADDGCRLQVDDDVVINSWYACPEDIDQAHRKASVSLTPGKHRIVIEYFQGQSLEGNDADPIKLYWTCRDLNIDRQIVPNAKLLHKAEDKLTPDEWAIKPPQTNQQLASNMWDDAQRAEETGDYPHALRLYRRILVLLSEGDIADNARARILAIEADPAIENK